jgi:trk system potassium uptake protein TrkA
MRIIIAGAGAVGRHLAKLLSREDMDISLIDDRQDRLGDLDASYDLLTKVGSPMSVHDLKSIGVKDVDLFIAVTPSESDNITACLLANQLGAKKTLARIDNYEYLIPENKRLFEQMGLNHLIYPELLAAQEITASLKTNWMRYHLTLCEGALELCVVKVREGAEVIGKQFLSGYFNHGLYRVVAIKRGQETIIPKGQDEIQADDMVYAVCTRENMKHLREQLGKQKKEIKNILFFGGSKIAQKTVQNLPDDLNIKIAALDNKFDLVRHLRDNTIDCCASVERAILASFLGRVVNFVV